MNIRNASPLDKDPILDFCKSTFSWGDYISEVWDFWINEGNLFVAENENRLIGLCHVVYFDSIAWIEGIRVHPDFRKIGVGSLLIKNSEIYSLKNKISDLFMLIEINNSASLNLAKKHGYTIFQTWNFYSLQPIRNDFLNCKIVKSESELSSFSKLQFYVDSWRWLKISNSSLKYLIQNKCIFSSNDNRSIGFLLDSKHFAKTKILTIFGEDDSLQDILRYVQNVCYLEKIQRIQILTPITLPVFDGLEKKLEFCLMHKHVV